MEIREYKVLSICIDFKQAEIKKIIADEENNGWVVKETMGFDDVVEKDMAYKRIRFMMVKATEADLSIKTKIYDTVSNLVTRFLFYDRKEDEELTEQDVDQAIEYGIVSVAEIAQVFHLELQNQVKGL